MRGVRKAELNGNIDSENNHGGSSMDIMYYIGAGCSQEDDKLRVKDASVQVHQEGKIGQRDTNWMAGERLFHNHGQ
jgi:hypothetical protein